MARYEDKIVHDVDGIEEYNNSLPGWLQAIFYASILFSVLYIAFYALNFGDDSMEAELQAETVAGRAAIQDYFDKNPLVPPSTEELLAGATQPEVLALGAERFAKTCASCHGDLGQGLIGPNLCDDSWLHGGKVTEVFQTIAKGVPAKGMPPWGRALAPEELSALVSHIRSIQGSNPANGRSPEGNPVAPEPLPAGAPATPTGEGA